MAARGILQGDRVLVPEEREANTLYNKGAFGVPQSGGSVRLDLLEATYLAENNRLDVEDDRHPLGAAEILAYAGSRDPSFDVRYVVYRDLRGRGFLVREGDANDFLVYPRGGFPGRSPASHRVLPTSERQPFDPRLLLDAVRAAAAMKRRLLLALVDEEGDLTYYDATDHDLRGVRAPDVPDASGLEGLLLGDRVLLLEEAHRERLEAHHLGTVVGPVLQLSLPEAVFLAREAHLRVRDPAGDLDAEAVAARARSVEPVFEARYRVYVDLRRRGLVPRTGFKFGCHFRAYEGHPNEAHAPYLVHALTPESALSWPEVAGFVRLAHGVRKEFLFALPEEGYLRLSRAKP